MGWGSNKITADQERELIELLQMQLAGLNLTLHKLALADIEVTGSNFKCWISQDDPCETLTVTLRINKSLGYNAL